MKPSLLQYLRCPISGEPLELRNAETLPGSTEIVSGTLTSASGASYPIREGVPYLLDPKEFAPGQQETVQSFSEKWKRAPDYRERTKHHYEQWYLERYGFNTLAGLQQFLSSKKRVLEAGTAHGRDAAMYATNSSADVFALDISEGIHLAYRDVGHLPNVHLVRADLRKPPFPKEFFDFIACDQVIHHTPNTYTSLQCLLKHLAPAGNIAFYVYKVKAPIREFCDDYIRERTVKMNPEECMEFSEAMTKLGKALSDLKVQIEVPEAIPILGLEKGTFDLQRWIYWNMFKCYWNDTIDWDSNVITNFDWYHPLHAHRHTPEEVKGWLGECNLTTVNFNIVESGISVLAKR